MLDDSVISNNRKASFGINRKNLNGSMVYSSSMSNVDETNLLQDENNKVDNDFGIEDAQFMMNYDKSRRMSNPEKHMFLNEYSRQDDTEDD